MHIARLTSRRHSMLRLVFPKHESLLRDSESIRRNTIIALSEYAQRLLQTAPIRRILAARVQRLLPFGRRKPVRLLNFDSDRRHGRRLDSDADDSDDPNDFDPNMINHTALSVVPR